MENRKMQQTPKVAEQLKKNGGCIAEVDLGGAVTVLLYRRRTASNECDTFNVPNSKRHGRARSL